MARPRKARLEGEVSDAERKGEAELNAMNLADIVEAFKAAHPDEWDALRLCPLQHGLEAMAEKLNNG